MIMGESYRPDQPALVEYLDGSVQAVRLKSVLGDSVGNSRVSTRRYATDPGNWALESWIVSTLSEEEFAQYRNTDEIMDIVADKRTCQRCQSPGMVAERIMVNDSATHYFLCRHCGHNEMAVLNEP